MPPGRFARMKAVIIDEFGGPEVLRVGDREMPEPDAGQVRVRVRAAGVNGVDAVIRSGAAQQIFPTKLPTVLGLEIAGVVDASGPNVDGLAVGDEVLGFADGGGYAEYALATTVAPKPAELGWAEAAALPVAAETALRVLNMLEVARDDTVLIHGAAGGVGTVAVQLAVARGATVIGTASEPNHDYLREIGATPVVYGEGLVDRVADPAAFGLGVTFSGEAARDAGALAEVARRAADGCLRVTVGETYSLEEAPAAQESVATGHGRGKVVLLAD